MSKNIDKWKDCYEEVLKSSDFRKSGRLSYAQTVGAEAYKTYEYLPGIRKVAVNPTIDAFAHFYSVSLKLLGAGRLDKFVAVAFRMFYVPFLEGNNNWLKDEFCDYFKTKDAKVVLLDSPTGSKQNFTQVHSVLKRSKIFNTECSCFVQRTSA